jgi:hypothetical protein
MTGHNIDRSMATGTGDQVAMVLRALRAHIGPAEVFAADMEAIYYSPNPVVSASASTLVRVGTLEEVQELVAQVGQFINGVLVIVPNGCADLGATMNVYTGARIEGLPDHCIQVHLFDTTVIEVYGLDPESAESLKSRFGGEVFNMP